ncbi:hypothetical protein, partial [Neisseria dentiae]|uniref:hypothetical protein n=1 Tax=Neisseria dentiae TaxID=194197 RepID=UPI0035A0BC15
TRTTAKMAGKTKRSRQRQTAPATPGSHTISVSQPQKRPSENVQTAFLCELFCMLISIENIHPNNKFNEYKKFLHIINIQLIRA